MKKFPDIHLQLPSWVPSFCQSTKLDMSQIENRMRFVIELANENVTRQTGGPFAAAVFNTDTHELIAPGVNLVTTANCSSAHAEIVALSIAQNVLQSFSLHKDNTTYELITSTEPCAMCLGAIPWSGISQVVCGARDEDARAVGFDEGAKPNNWELQLEVRGIHCIKDILRHEASDVLKHYASSSGLIYNGN